MKDLIDVHTHDYDYQGNVKTIKVAYSYNNFHKSDLVGIAPQNYKEYQYDLEQYISGKLGVGEIGLDYYWVREDSERKAQREVFEHQLRIAEKMNGIVEIHCRDAYEDILNIMSSYNLKRVIFHFFSGNLNHYRAIIDRGWYISIPPKPSSVRKQAIKYNISHLLCETDSPYVTDSPDRVIESYKFIAEVSGQNLDRVVELILDNYNSFISR
ncbi:MAG: TatD family hydrolase [Candidatus Anstonellales archaeon]